MLATLLIVASRYKLGGLRELGIVSKIRRTCADTVYAGGAGTTP
jgi:hypothetical protein